MSSNVGLSTPRGSGTSGYVQRNASLLKPRPYNQSSTTSSSPYSKPPQSFQPSAQILQHDRLRTLEIQILALRDDLEESSVPPLSEEEIDERCDALREKLTREMEAEQKQGGKRKDGSDIKKMKRYAVHDLAEAKGRESEKLRRALGLKSTDKEEEGEHPMARQERRRRERDEERLRMDGEREEGE